MCPSKNPTFKHFASALRRLTEISLYDSPSPVQYSYPKISKTYIDSTKSAVRTSSANDLLTWAFSFFDLLPPTLFFW